MVLPRFVKAAKANQPLTIHGDGSQSRTFGHIQDAIDAVLALLATEKSIGDTVPFLPTNQNMVMQISMVQSQLQAFLQRVRISRAWIDFEYEKQMMSMQQLMASYSQMIVLMNEGAGGVKPNEETVAAK